MRSVIDYRSEFFASYHIAVGTSAVNGTHYEQCSRQFRGRWARWLPADKSAAMLDLGCGCGEFLYFLRSVGYENVGGVDLCEGELKRARQIGIPNLTCASALEYLDNKKESFDVISALNLFEHLRKDEILRLLKLIHQALKPGGRLLAVTPNGLSPFGGATRYWDFSHETGFTPASWRQIARITGFHDVCFQEYGPIPHSVSGIIRVALWRLVRWGLEILCYIEVGGPRDGSRVYTADMKVILTK
jgi:SAM-dependent methyltransferase